LEGWIGIEEGTWSSNNKFLPTWLHLIPPPKFHFVLLARFNPTIFSPKQNKTKQKKPQKYQVFNSNYRVCSSGRRRRRRSALIHSLIH